MIKQAADGHGGIFEAMRKNGVLYDMKEKGIEWVYIGGVDNVLAKMVDPVLTGLAISEGNLMAGKSVVKANPQEKVGVFCKKDNRPNVIEYTEISKELAEATDDYRPEISNELLERDEYFYLPGKILHIDAVYDLCSKFIN